ncbi:MAG: TIGR00366 family protein, partial [Pseudomonadota bacterium]|nr:TIGR00366 family protein [Pseudomonadota bacterium]
LIQPFWALPVLAIAGLRAKDIMGYCLVQLIITGVIISLVLHFM